MIKGLRRSGQRRPQTNRKTVALLLDQLTQLLQRGRLGPEDGPGVVLRTLRQRGPVAPLVGERLQGAAQPAEFVEIREQRVHRGGMAECAVTKATEQ